MRLSSCLLLLSLIACSAHEKKMGRGEIYHGEEITAENKAEMNDKFVKSMFRDSPKGFHDKAFHAPNGSIKKIGFIFFETTIQPTLDGLSSEPNYYFTNHAKQIYTETLYKKWLENIKKWDPKIELVKVEDAFAANLTYKNYIEDFVDYVTEPGEELLPQDVQYLEKGKSTTINSLMMPRKFKDLSLLGSPVAMFLTANKYSDYHKYWLSDVAQELDLDAFLVVYSKMSWDRQSVDPLDVKKIIPESGKIKIEAAFSMPYKRYQSLLKDNGYTPALNPGSIPFMSYEETALIELKIEKPKPEQSSKAGFDENVWNKMFPAYTNMVQLMTDRMEQDLLGTLQ